jgi:hypothetical protein
MQIKAAEGHQGDVLALERLLDRPGVPGATRKRIEAEVRQIQAGEKAERDAAYQIELYFGRSENWATIHDLRFEVDGLAVQIDHLIINRYAEIWVCESKSFAEGVSINEHGEWSRWWHGHADGMRSPIAQNRQHMFLLERLFDDGLAPLPRRLGLASMKPRLRSLVLVSDNARISRPKRKVDGIEDVIKAEQLRTRLIDAIDAASISDMARLIGKEQLASWAKEIAALHRPIAANWAARFGLDQAASPGSEQPPAVPVKAPPRRPWLVKYDGPCANCGQILPKGTEAVWNQSQHKMHCLECAGRGRS